MFRCTSTPSSGGTHLKLKNTQAQLLKCSLIIIMSGLCKSDCILCFNIVYELVSYIIVIKYKSLCIEIQRIWNMKCMFVPVVIAATGIVTKVIEKNLEAIPGKHSIDSLQKTAIQ